MDGALWKQTAIIVFIVGTLFWLGYTYSTVMTNGELLDIVNERQRDVRERLSALEARLHYVETFLQHFDQSDERWNTGGRPHSQDQTDK